MSLVFCVHGCYNCSVRMWNFDGPLDFVQVVKKGDYVVEAAIDEI